MKRTGPALLLAMAATCSWAAERRAVEVGPASYDTYDSSGTLLSMQRPHPTGGILHYDGKGRLLGWAKADSTGGTAFFAADGSSLGRAVPNFSTGEDYFDAAGRYLGMSVVEPGGGVRYVDQRGRQLQVTLWPISEMNAAASAAPGAR